MMLSQNELERLLRRVLRPFVDELACELKAIDIGEGGGGGDGVVDGGEF